MKNKRCRKNMKKYDEKDFMPPSEREELLDSGKAEAEVSDETAYMIEEKAELPEQEDIGVGDEKLVEEEKYSGTVVQREIDIRPVWARYVSMIFMPLLIPTYAMAMAMWLTPLSQINENTRFGVTFMVLLLTALAPTSYLLTMVRLGRLKLHDFVSGLNRIMPCAVFIVCLIIAAYYLFRISAPEWLIMFMVGGSATTLAVYLFQYVMKISSNTAGMGALTAAIVYLGKNNLIEGPVMPWIVGLILLSGVVGSAQVALTGCKIRRVTVGYALGFVVLYSMLNLHFLTMLTGNGSDVTN